MSTLPTNLVADELNTEVNTYRRYNILDSNGETVEGDVHLEEITSYTQRGSEVSAEHINEIGRQLNAINTINDFPITTTGWVTNDNARNSDTYTVKQEIETTVFANTPSGKTLDGLFLSATDDEVMTTAEMEDKAKLCTEITHDDEKITIYATEATTNALRLRVIGV